MVAFLKQVFTEFSEDSCSQMAAALAYYMAFSLAPLLILLIMVAGFFFEPSDVQGTVQEEIAAVVGQEGADQVKSMLENASKPEGAGIAGILSLAGLLFGATGVVVQLQQALNEAWQVKPDPEQGGVWSFLTKRLLSLVMILGLGGILIASLAVSALIGVLDDQLLEYLPEGMEQGAAALINYGITLLVLIVLFAAIFKFLPDAVIRWRDVAVGATVTALLFLLGNFLLGWYLGSKNMGSTYGSAGSLVLILLWVYYSAMMFLLGAEFTQVWTKRRGRRIEPQAGAIKVQEESVAAKHP